MAEASKVTHSFSVALGLGSNIGDRLQFLKSAVQLLSERVLADVRVSPVVETSAWLKAGAPREWNQPFLNLVIEGSPLLSRGETFAACQKIERELGRGTHEIWSPRVIDIDLLAWGQDQLHNLEITIPHPGAAQRPFVLDPWMAMNPERRLPVTRTGDSNESQILALRRALPDACPLLMGIVNITPDSFSDGGLHFAESQLQAYFQSVVDTPPAIIDLGGQSTRPGAELIGTEEEWRRLSRALDQVASLHSERVRPWISIDTFRGELAQKAVEWGVEMINDVSGFADPHMIELAAGAKQTQFVFMHHLGIPVVRGQTLPADCNPVETVRVWAEKKIEELVRRGVPTERLIFDPGIGFGKTPAQSMALIRGAGEFKKLPVRVLYGHSRKSYQKSFAHEHAHLDPADIDAFTVQQSLELAHRGVEFLRVHNVPAHRAALLRFFSTESAK